MFGTLRVTLLVVGLTVAAHAVRADDKPNLPALEAAFQDAIQKAEPSIVCVLVSRSSDLKNHNLDDPAQVPESFGSGIVIDAQGLVLTCYHVVRDAVKVYVRLPGGKGSFAEIHAADPRSDLAVLSLLDKKLPPLKVVKLGNGGAVRKGSLVVGLANPYAAGFRDGSPSASWGIISNVRRRVPARLESDTQYKSLAQLGTLLQTDVRLNLGCSGGALIDLKGELIGITTALAAVTGVETPGGFALPMDDGLKRIIDVLRRGGEVEYGFLGVGFTRPTDPMRKIEGVAVSRVIPGSPAARSPADQEDKLRADPAGQKGDIIVAINDVKVREPDDVFLILATLLAGSTAKVEVVRYQGVRPEVVPITLAKAYVPGTIVASRKPDAVGGLRVDYSSLLYLRPNGDVAYSRGIPSGVMIREVLTGTAADNARLQEGKVIQKVNGKSVTTPDEFHREMRNAGAKVELVVLNAEGREDVVKLDLK